MQEDLQARGLQHRVGNVLDMAGLVALIAQKVPRAPGVAEKHIFKIIQCDVVKSNGSELPFCDANCINLDSPDNRA